MFERLNSISIRIEDPLMLNARRSMFDAQRSILDARCQSVDFIDKKRNLISLSIRNSNEASSAHDTNL